jgi:hypothetical protein
MIKLAGGTGEAREVRRKKKRRRKGIMTCKAGLRGPVAQAGMGEGISDAGECLFGAPLPRNVYDGRPRWGGKYLGR